VGNGGWHGTREEWDRFEAPVRRLDSIFEAFAARHGLTVSRNGKDWPERSVSWGDDVRCLIQIWRVSEESPALKVWICASQDRGLKRFWKRAFLAKDADAEVLRPSLPAMLDKGFEQLKRWELQPDTFEYAGPVAATPGD
jgi:hypothetical protein